MDEPTVERTAGALILGTLMLVALEAVAAIAGAAVPARPEGPAPAVRILAAENFYGDVARQIAGPAAQVDSVLRNPDADPHLFETDAATARAVVSAQLLIYNGAGYDTWMVRLIDGSHVPPDRIIELAALMQRQGLQPQGQLVNPHLWYDPATMPALARALTARLQQVDPEHSAAYAQRLSGFLSSLRPLEAAIATLKHRYAGAAVTATEPVANDLTDAIGLRMLNRRFQLSVMNDTEPGARDTAAFEQSLRSHAVRLLIYNRQASSGSVQRLLGIAHQAGVPIVGVSETEPAGVDYQRWMLDEIHDIGNALGQTHP